jgi:hypothetical protein
MQLVEILVETPNLLCPAHIHGHVHQEYLQYLLFVLALVALVDINGLLAVAEAVALAGKIIFL